MKYIYLLTLSIIANYAFGQEKEVLIIGTMHTVPKIVKNSYKPLLKFAKKYNPEAIYVERVRPSDTISLNYYYKNFVRKADSLKQIFVIDNQRFKKLRHTDLNQFSNDDFVFMAKAYFVKKDYANYYYYAYLKKYGLKGSRKPLRNENADLTSKLAIALNVKHIFSMDDQQTNKEYQIAWKKCVEIGTKNGDNKISRKLNRKDYNKAIIPAIFGRLGKHTNKPKSLHRKHVINSFRYVRNTNPACENGTRYWDERNYKMARNIAEQVHQQPFKKNIVIVGAGHVMGIKEALEEKHPELKIKLMYE